MCELECVSPLFYGVPYVDIYPVFLSTFRDFSAYFLCSFLLFVFCSFFLSFLKVIVC